MNLFDVLAIAMHLLDFPALIQWIEVLKMFLRDEGTKGRFESNSPQRSNHNQPGQLLSKLQVKILTFSAAGWYDEFIARGFRISAVRVKSNWEKILTSLEVTTPKAAIHFATVHGIIDPADVRAASEMFVLK